MEKIRIRKIALKKETPNFHTWPAVYQEGRRGEEAWVGGKKKGDITSTFVSLKFSLSVRTNAKNWTVDLPCRLILKKNWMNEWMNEERRIQTVICIKILHTSPRLVAILNF